MVGNCSRGWPCVRCSGRCRHGQEPQVRNVLGEVDRRLVLILDAESGAMDHGLDLELAHSRSRDQVVELRDPLMCSMSVHQAYRALGIEDAFVQT